MKKWIGCIAIGACLFSTPIYPDEAPSAPVEVPEETPPQPPKQVGKAASDSAQAAKKGVALKYAIAAGTVILGITALILVSRHHGHH